MTHPRVPTLLLALALAATLTNVALAHGGEAGPADAADLADQAIAYLQAEPPNTTMASDRIQDALTAEQAPTDVNLELVKAAGIALKQGALPQTVQLLDAALGKPGQTLGPIVTVRVGAGYYLAFAVAALLIGLGAYGLGRRSGHERRPSTPANATNAHE